MPQAARASKKSKVYRYPLPFRAEAKIFFPVLCPFDRGKESAFAVLSHCHFERSEKSAFLHLFTIILCKPSFPFCHPERSRSNATAQSRDPGAASCDDADTRSSTENACGDTRQQSAKELRESAFPGYFGSEPRTCASAFLCCPCRGFVLFLTLTQRYGFAYARLHAGLPSRRAYGAQSVAI
jgi:hypothetical protein